MKWISVKDKLPPLNISIYGPSDDSSVHVLVMDENKDIFVAYRDNDTWFIACNCYEGSFCNVTHWMPLPSLPKE